MNPDCHPDGKSVFDQIFALTPCPMVMLAQDGSVLAASDDDDAVDSCADLPLRQRVPTYLAALDGGAGWRREQKTCCMRTLRSGLTLHEQLVLKLAPWGASLSVLDQTELHRLQANERQTARLASLGFMVAGVCHEMTNPLTSLHSIVQILRAEREPTPALLGKGLENIAGNVRRILDISRRLLHFSRVGDEPRVRLAIDDVVEEALYVLRHDHLLDRIELRHQRDPRAVVIANVGQVREILLNLLVNAAQAMGGVGAPGGMLAVTTRGLGRSVEVLVSDSGPGIAREVVDRIFEPFFTTKPTAIGTGLGLAISAELAREHGGLVELRENSARGATFCLMLPGDLP